MFGTKLENDEIYHGDFTRKELQKFVEQTDFVNGSLFRRQEEILLITVYLLLHISENKIIEMKMLKKGLISSLICLLDRFNLELLILSVCFLKKLSIFIENKDQMLKLSIISRLHGLISINYVPLTQITLRLMFNLSFDHSFQKHFLSKIFPDFRSSDFVNTNEISTMFGMLYHVSIHPVSYTYFQNSETILYFKQLIQLFDSEIVDQNFVALLINLHQSFEIAELILDFHTLNIIIKRSFDLKDPCLLKIVSTGVNHIYFAETLLHHYSHFLINQLHNCTIEVMLLEIYKILNCTSLLNIKLIQPLIDFNIISFLVKTIKYYSYLEDDLLLEIIIFIGLLTFEQILASMLIHNGLVNVLIEIFREKQEDDEIVIQIVYIFYTLLFHPMTRKNINSESHILAYLSELLNDNNKLIASYSDDALNLIIEQNPTYATSILQERFNWHNLQWLELLNEDNLEEIQIQNSDIDNIWLQFAHSTSEVEFL